MDEGRFDLPMNDKAHQAREELYYTPTSLAARWGCSKDLIYDLLRQGRLRGFKLGRDWRISDEARLAYERDPDNSEKAEYSYTRRPGRRARASAVMRVV